MPIALDQLDRWAPEGEELIDEPLRRPATIVGVGGQSTDAGDSKKFEELRQQPGFFAGDKLIIHWEQLRHDEGEEKTTTARRER